MTRRWFVVALILLSSTAAYARSYRISVWVRNNAISIGEYNNRNNGMMHEVNPVSYRLLIDGSGAVSIDESRVITTVNAGGAEIIPVIQNIVTVGGVEVWSPQATNWILENPQIHADQLLGLLNRNPDYAGIELDYESMLDDIRNSPDFATIAADRRFKLTRLAEIIKATIGPKKLSICVYRRTDNSFTSGSTNSRIYDYAGLSGPYAADRLKIMMYHDIGAPTDPFNPSNALVSNSGLDAALNWANFAIVNHDKLIVALPWYGHNFTNNSLSEPPPVTGVTSRNASGELRFRDTSNHEWLVVDEESFRQKILRSIRTHDVGGFAMWDAGKIRNFSGVWEVLRGRLGTEGAWISSHSIPLCQTTPYPATASFTVPWGATEVQFPWFEWGFNSGNYKYKVPGFVNGSGYDQANPGLPGGSYYSRVNGVIGQRVFEAESANMVSVACRTRPSGS